ncbi:anthranilate synthase component I family protein [Rathayibacter sp. YIM 133350]|uniref:anthranilate synthase component I family protein n=1 Tax=Rathayibacter sp. YIM 133350 TaxID=3131992 RepID=UPI00307D8CEC
MLVARRHPLPGWHDPEAVFRRLFARERTAFWLDGGADAVAGRSWMGSSREWLTASVSGGTVTHHGPAGERSRRAGIFEALADELGEASPALDAVIGWVGWLGYEVGQQSAGVPLPASPYPDAALLRATRVIGFDHGRRIVELVGLDDDPGFEAWALEVQARLDDEDIVWDAESPLPSPGTPVARWRHGETDYLAAIDAAQAAIARGDAYQLCLTNSVTVPGVFDPLETYRRVRASSPSHHGGFLRFGEIALLSASPEQFLRVDAGRGVRTRPIKGTRPRGGTLAADIAMRAELEASEKEQAENLMIVDLMRNDLGRVARLGSVRVSSLLAVESYAHVHQLVSTVEADLADGRSALDAVRACFPAGSMTGAPKISAMRILSDLEKGPRGVYSGAFGYLGFDGTADLAMVIRSIVLTPDAAAIGTGGGITALSVPREEVDEMRLKARALLAALGVDAD